MLQIGFTENFQWPPGEFTAYLGNNSPASCKEFVSISIFDHLVVKTEELLI